MVAVGQWPFSPSSGSHGGIGQSVTRRPYEGPARCHHVAGDWRGCATCPSCALAWWQGQVCMRGGWELQHTQPVQSHKSSWQCVWQECCHDFLHHQLVFLSGYDPSICVQCAVSSPNLGLCVAYNLGASVFLLMFHWQLALSFREI